MSVESKKAGLDPTGIAVRALYLYSLAEFQSGHATAIRITAEGNSFSIADNGRGHSIDRAVEGTSYLKFIYTHFDYPFESGQSSPIQLQGIGMSIVNALCSELVLTVRKRDETLELLFRDGNLHERKRLNVKSDETGMTIAAVVSPKLQSDGVALEQLQDWLMSTVAASPSLNLYFNGRRLQASSQNEA